MKELSVSKLENLEGGKFWGWDDVGSADFRNDSSCPSGKRIFQRQEYRVFWLSVTRIKTRDLGCAMF